MITHIPSSLWKNRKGWRLTQQQLGTLLGGFDQSVMARFEAADRVPPLSAAYRLSLLFDLPVELLFPRLYAEQREELIGEIQTLKQTLDDDMPDEQAKFLDTKLSEALARLEIEHETA